MSVSPKVSAATVGASLTTVVVGILGPHVFPHGMPADVQGLIAAVVTAGITFGSGYFARHDAEVTKVESEVKADAAKADVIYTKVRQSAPVAEAVQAVAAVAAPQAPAVAAPQAVAQPLPVSHPL